MALGFIKPNITFYDKCDVMPLWNFQKYLDTKDLRYFTKEHKEHKDLDNIALNLFGEYLELSGNRAVVLRFEKIFELMRLKGKYDTVTLILKALYNYPNPKDIEGFKILVNELEKWNYRIDKEKDIFKQLETIYTRLQGIKTKISILESEIDVEDEKESTTIGSQLILVSRILELRYSLNSKEITLSEWIEYQKQAEKVNLDKQKQLKK